MMNEKKKILIVDDNLQSRKLMKGILEWAGYEVELVEGGEEALEMLAQDRDFSLIVTDMFMPFMMGVEFVEELRENPATKDIPILGMSAHRVERGDMDVNDFISKPFVADHLLEKVRKLTLD